MDALFEAATHAGAECHSGFAIAVTQFVGSFEGLAPAFGASAIHEIELSLIRHEVSGLNADEADRAAESVPQFSVEKIAGVLDEVDICELRGPKKRCGPG